ncbi:MAG: hypothetical protein ACAI25_12520 [Planctomycetota bacterium]
MTDPQDSYHAHQARRQVYVVLRVDEGDATLASRFTVVKIVRRYEDAQREVEKLNAPGATARHLWQVGWLTLDDGPAEAPRELTEMERLRAERDFLREEVKRLRG